MTKLTFALTSLLLGTSLLAAWPFDLWPAHADREASQMTAVQTLQTEQPNTQNDIPAPSLQNALDRFIGELSSHGGFEEWKQGAWITYPLGPGTHGWIVIVTVDGKEAGYLVVHTSGQDTYRLIEYGKGEYPLFSMQTLYHSLVRLEIIEYLYHAERIYYNPLQALWKVTVPETERVWYIDAKTGEELPLENDDQLPKSETGELMKPLPFTTTESSHKITATGQTEPTDAYERLPWIQGKAETSLRFEVLQQWIDQGRKPVFVAELYSGRVHVPLAVSGYQVWSSGESFLEVLQDDKRYLPLNAINPLGGFYP
ncbi:MULTISPECIES: hypothetical protein [unclassified Paenibacillus]|uniref:hypothetical protein n=1 Tax=unclassified Paenibacillus TaxID=185978 RepID=UPI001AE7F8FF|nr:MULTISPECIES: hypothetical protein [unclassified Paenibacillus]MBP1154826.1 hypothetical protein [Paenibacillus sp. PvP091]MBP1169790.1 hypothetical protein [Paenibacillus sp. PvR098]MBP2440818.1 hypothetical protein [Paenibacillus sp. PvP052]